MGLFYTVAQEKLLICVDFTQIQNNSQQIFSRLLQEIEVDPNLVFI